MKNKHIFFGILMMVACSESFIFSASQREIKAAIERAGKRAVMPYMAARLGPALAGAAVAAIPGLVAIFAMAAYGDPTLAKETSDMIFAAHVGGALLALPGLKAGEVIIKRQMWLMGRDEEIYKQFTSSATYLEPSSLPSIAKIDRMDNYHQLLTAASDYYQKEGNAAEQRKLNTPLFKGYKETRLQ